MTLIITLVVIVVVFRSVLWFGDVWITGAEANDERTE